MKNRLRKKHLASNEKITSMLANCYVCDEVTTKSNYCDGVYLCDKCKKLSSEELYTKIVDATRDILIDDPIFDNKDVLKSLIKTED